MDSDTSLTNVALQHLLRELAKGPSGFGNWVLDADSAGYQGLRSLSAAEASARPAERASIAAHVRHATYGLDLINRWAQGEENPFATADWASTWVEQPLTESQWDQLLQQLIAAAEQWSDAVAQQRTWDEISLTGAMASVAHLAYHLGAIAQRR